MPAKKSDVDDEVLRLQLELRGETEEARQAIQVINKIINNGTGALVYRAIMGREMEEKHG